MYVLPNSDFECLLGLNWFLEMRVSISPADRTIKFQSEIFSLEDSDPLFNSDVDESLFLTNIDLLVWTFGVFSPIFYII